MFLTTPDARPLRALIRRHVSRTISAFVLFNILALSMPAAPRTIVDAATSVTSIEMTAPSLPTLDTSSLPAIDTAPLAAIYHNSIAFAGRIQAVVMPTLPTGLENAKPPTLTERLVPHVQPILALITPTRSAIRNPQSEIEPPPPQPTSVVDFDFDNDGKADVGRWRVANTEFQIRNSNGGSLSSFTLTAASKIAPGDFNGGGKTDAAVFSTATGAGVWTYKTSPSATVQTISFGSAGDIPVAGDYDGDGTTDAAVYRPSTNTWWIKKSSDDTTTSTTFGSANDITVPGDYS